MTNALRKVEMKKNRRSACDRQSRQMVGRSSSLLTSSREPLGEPVAGHADEIQADETCDAERGIEFGLRQIFQ